MAEERLTEDEWRQREARRECANYGHDWNIISTYGGGPIALHCSRPCGAPSYRVTPPELTEEDASS